MMMTFNTVASTRREDGRSSIDTAVCKPKCGGNGGHHHAEKNLGLKPDVDFYGEETRSIKVRCMVDLVSVTMLGAGIVFGVAAKLSPLENGDFPTFCQPMIIQGWGKEEGIIWLGYPLVLRSRTETSAQGQKGRQEDEGPE
ncbi:hypothetical protein Bbelb_231470 [Branchiostoma belcheri]|nr:hypothetical protein Bbelb_231470 [Branchiostoma belcheri]